MGIKQLKDDVLAILSFHDVSEDCANEIVGAFEIEPFDLAAELARLTNLGYAPNIIYDDEGSFAVSDEGFCSVRMTDTDDFHGSVCGKAAWFEPTPQKAWGNYLERLRNMGNEV